MARMQMVIVGVVLTSVAVAAQQATTPTPSVSPEVQIQQRRFQLQLMEGVLESAIRQGAQEVANRAQGETPIGLLFMGRPRAHGFPLEHYGLVFDVEVPKIRESYVMRNQMARSAAPSPQVGTPVSGRGTVGTARATGVVTDDPMLRSPVTGDPFLVDPDQFYRDVIKGKLIDAMLDYSRSLELGEADSLSIVARSEEDPVPTGLYDDSQALILRIKGTDLKLWFEGKITRDEARKRVVESQF